MIVCDDFVFLHLHKSGGTFVNQLMMRCLPSARPIGYHLPYAELPAPFRHLPVLGTVRNPWSYYVSWYHFQAQQSRPNSLFLIVSEKGTLGFRETITNLVNLESDESRIDQLIDASPDHFVNHGLNLTKSCVSTLRGCGVGFYSFLYQRLYNGSREPHIVSMEKLRAGVASFLRAQSIASINVPEQFLAVAPKMNVTPHEHYRTYYDDGLKDLIARRDRPVTSAHDYQF